MILLVKIVGHVNIFVFLLLMITLTVFILILLILILLKRLRACFADGCQVRTLEKSFISLVLNVGTKSLMSSETYSWQVFTPCKNYLLGNPLHGCRVLNFLFGKLSFGIHRFVNTKLYFCSSTALVLNDVLNGLLESASNES